MTPRIGAATVPAAVRLRGGVSPLDFDGGDLDAKLDQAIAHSIDRIEVLDLRNLPVLEIARPMVLSRRSEGDGAWLAPKSVMGGGTRIVAREPMACMIDMQNCFGKVLQGFRIFGENRARMLIDTSWTVSPAPAMNCRWSDLELRGAAGPVSWRADGNNDCDFAFVQIQGPVEQPAHVAISLLCGGGDLSLFRVRCYAGKLIVSAQSITVTNCVTKGIKVVGADFNLLSLSGGYHYAAPDSRTNIEIAADAGVVALKADGAHVENGYDGGHVLGGSGALRGGASFEQCHVFATANAKAIRLVGPMLTSGMGSGVRQVVRLSGGSYGAVDLADTAALAISREGVNQAQAHIVQRRAGGGLSVFEDAGAGLYRHEHPAWGPLATMRSATTGECRAGQTVRIPLDGWPLTGRLIVRATNDQCGRAMFDYDLPSGTIVLASAYGGSTIRAGIAGKALSLTHATAGEVAVFLLAATGL